MTLVSDSSEQRLDDFVPSIASRRRRRRDKVATDGMNRNNANAAVVTTTTHRSLGRGTYHVVR
jgi:hypothetical protein